MNTKLATCPPEVLSINVTSVSAAISSTTDGYTFTVTTPVLAFASSFTTYCCPLIANISPLTNVSSPLPPFIAIVSAPASALAFTFGVATFVNVPASCTATC